MRTVGVFAFVALVAIGSFLAGRCSEAHRAERRTEIEDQAKPAVVAGPTLSAQSQGEDARLETLEDVKALLAKATERARLQGITQRKAGIKSALDSSLSVDELIAKFRALPPGEREPVLWAIMTKLRVASRKSKDLTHLDFFKELLKDKAATSKERRWAIIVAHVLGHAQIGGLLDYYDPYLHDADPAVRLYAIEGLVWIRGDEAQQAHEKFRAALADPDYKIRSVTAAFMALVLKDPRDADLLGRHLLLERNAEVAEAMMTGIQRLDPGGYEGRLRDAIPRVPDEIRPLVAARLED